MNNKILCIGEFLWDSLPKGLFLGGAPFNVACHLNMLGEDCKMISRVGHDLLGNQAILRLTQKGLSHEFIQIDEKYSTGLVNALLDVNGNASYNILEPAAWDFIELNDNITSYASGVKVMIFGSLAQRNPKNRFTIKTLRKNVPLTVFDVNLRPPFDNVEIIRESLIGTNIVKMNDSELSVISKWFGFPSDLKQAANALSSLFNTETVCITQGEKGAFLWNKNSWAEHPGYKVKVQDTVGSGDAFLAALVAGILAGNDNYKILAFANAVGAYVASCDGATPVLHLNEIYELQNSRDQLQ